ncbi:hypothetical protein OB919_14400 [Halobacteria archaeon AArc-curdl1]|uniref:Uncharacterized protein n=1 Tax=Natronosalvus hydrolyticus TaxID=2979988 RepID=A0AAP2ZA13_9EURY|nr:hypothetical protein [Halobacteria archaeon AArc-curdl1]
MPICETLPMAPDTVINEDNPIAFTEPVEVGPFTQGIVFVQIIDYHGEPDPVFEVGVSPSGYDDWDLHWAPITSLTDVNSEGMYAIQLDNFGNWLQIRSELNAGNKGEICFLVWFVGTG